MIYLRPHHLLCTQGYSGKGYSEGFVSHMNEVGEDLCDTQEKVKRFDQKVVDYFGLEEKEYSYQELIREIDAKMTEEMLADICEGCGWFPISACRKNICKK